MSTPTFAATHNLVAFLEKPTESNGFEQILDFINANPIKYALTVNPTKIIIIEASIRSDLHFDDAEAFLDKQVEGMNKHKEIFVVSSHTKKIFANMRRQADGFSGRITPLFDTMRVQASEEVAMDSNHQTIHLINHLHPQNPRRNKSPGGDRGRKLRVLKLSLKMRTIRKGCSGNKKYLPESLKKTVKKLKKKRRSRLVGLRRLKRIGAARKSKSSKDKDNLGDQEDSSKQGRNIKDIDQDEAQEQLDEEMFRVDDLHGEEVTIEDIAAKQKSMKKLKAVTTVASQLQLLTVTRQRLKWTQGQVNDEEMFRVSNLHGEEVTVKDNDVEVTDTTAAKIVSIVEIETSAAPSTAAVSPTVVTEVEITLAQTLVGLKSAKSKVVMQESKKSTIVTTTDVVIQEPGETTTRKTIAQPPTSKDKGKAIMTEPEKPLKMKDQIAANKELARKLNADMQAELVEEERTRRKKEEEANLALIELWKNKQAMMEADRLLAERLQAREREELIIE
ncbi:hypothetical protein Tco_1136295 [Tanacetum coccineum]